MEWVKRVKSRAGGVFRLVSAQVPRTYKWRGYFVICHEILGLSSGSRLVFCLYALTDHAIALVANSLMFVLVQSRVVGLPVEGLSADGALEDVHWTACSPETRASL